MCVRLEILKLTRRMRSYLGFWALAAMSGLMVLGMALGPPPFEQSFPQGLVTVGSYLNGGFVAWALLRMATQFFLPLFACVVTGDMISGEAADGTLRAILSRPIKRGSFYTGKFAVSTMYVVALTFFLGITAYLAGNIFLGRGALVTFQEGTMLGAQGIHIFGEMDGLIRLIAAYTFASLGVLAVATVAFFLSAIVMNSLGAIGGAMMTLILFQIVGAIDYFKPIRPFLFTTHIDASNAFFANPIPWADVERSALVLLAYVVVFFTAGLLVFQRKDVLS